MHPHFNSERPDPTSHRNNSSSTAPLTVRTSQTISPNDGETLKSSRTALSVVEVDGEMEQGNF
jgi:hypothetical protein